MRVPWGDTDRRAPSCDLSQFSALRTSGSLLALFGAALEVLLCDFILRSVLYPFVQHNSGRISSPASASFHQRSVLIFTYMLLYQKDKRAKAGNFPKNNALVRFSKDRPQL